MGKESRMEGGREIEESLKKSKHIKARGNSMLGTYKDYNDKNKQTNQKNQAPNYRAFS